MIVALLASLSPLRASADTACWTIQNPAERADCRARESRNPGDCTFIEDRARREECRARASGTAADCNTLSSEWERQKCRDAAGERR
ncbi:MAG TPA: hypothetical protein VEC57_16540 [Candidatus Limnocylindrales bacterium]|nr:hypothetical protein [Candidatus Limnocylindrales bacterium]